MATQEYPKSR